MQDELAQKNKKMMVILCSLVAGMVGLSFASVPLYNLFCAVTGYGGTTQVSDYEFDVILDRTIKIQFTADVDKNLPWDFKPEVTSVDLQLGQTGLMNYIAENSSEIPVVGNAVYNVSPPKAGLYFQKVQCFCFDEQVLLPGQKVNMPVTFFVDPALDEDPNLRDVTTITLSYTFFKAQSQEFDEAKASYFETVEQTNTENGASAIQPSVSN